MDPTPKQPGKRPLGGLDGMLERMPEAPQRRGPHHRRAHSDTSFRFPLADEDDDLLLFDPSDLDLSSLVADLPPATPGPPPPMAPTDSDDSSSSAAPPRTRPPVNHFRSLSVDSDFFDGLNLGPATVPAGERSTAVGDGGQKRAGAFHRHSSSMDGFSTASFELDPSGLVDGVKKALAPERLAELALIDPKRAKRILANRQSAARSKERKIRYTGELERKVQTLQTEATTLSAQVTVLQRDTSGLTVENKELKLRLQAMEQQAHLRDALNEALREEVQRLKIATGQIPAANGNAFNRSSMPPQYSSHQPPMHPFGSHQNAQQQQQQQFHMPQSSISNQTLHGHPSKSFSNFG